MTRSMPLSNRKLMEMEGWKFQVWARGPTWIEIFACNERLRYTEISHGATEDDAIAKLAREIGWRQKGSTRPVRHY